MTITDPTPVDLESTVIDLNAGWYNYLAQAFKLNVDTFLLAQGTLGLQTSDSSGLFRISDAVPPSASVAYYDEGLSRRSSAYAMLLQALLPETGSDLADALGDMYTKWLTYRDSYFDKNPESDKSQKELFNQWADQRLDPTKATKAKSVYKKEENAPLNKALDELNNPAYKEEFRSSDDEKYLLYRYSATHDDARKALDNGQPVAIDFSSATMDTTLSHTTVDGTATGFYDFFSGEATGKFEKMNKKAAGSNWSISGEIQSYATLSTQPAAWFDSGEYSRAYKAKGDRKIWDPLANAGNWDSFFEEPDGSLVRRASQLLLVGQYDLTVTSEATYDESELEKIQAEASAGIWPFFSISTSVSNSYSATLNQDAQLTINWSAPAGSCQIWGVIVASGNK